MRVFDTWTRIPAGWIRVTEQIEVARFTGDSMLGEPRIVPATLDASLTTRIRTKIPADDYRARCKQGTVSVERLT